MSLGAPLALLGLLALPLVWWFHKKLRTPPEVVLPSLMFLQDEDDASKLPSGRRFDAELLLALAAVALLAFAAAEPVLVGAKPRRVVRVVVSGGAPATLEGYAAAVRAATAEVRAALAPEDKLELRWIPAVDAVAPRPTEQTLLGAAMAGAASARIVISDRAPAGETGAIRWIAVGSPQTSNTGIVGVSVEHTETVREVFCAVSHHGPGPARGRIGLEGAAAQTFEIAPGEVATFRFATERLPRTLRLTAADGGVYRDGLAADDSVVLRADVPPSLVDPALPDAHRQSIEEAFAAVLGSAEDRPAAGGPYDVAVLKRGSPDVGARGWTLEIEPVAEGAPAERAPEGSDAIGQDPLAKDLSTAGVEWVYAKGAAKVQDGERVLLARRAGGRLWPVLLARGRVLRLAPDPLRGEPRAVDTPFWPLLIDNLLAASAGRGIGGGCRAEGLLDPASSEPGVARIPLDEAALRASPPSVPGRVRPLRPLLIACALACLGLLWAAPRIRRRLTPRPALAGADVA